MKKIYIIGPTVGINRLNIDAFVLAQEQLAAKERAVVVVPHDLFTDDEQVTMSVADAVKRRKQEVAKCDEVRYLYGWYTDDAAKAEMTEAITHNKLIRPFYP